MENNNSNIKENSEELIIKEEEKINNFFDHFELLELEDFKKEEVAKKINDESKGDLVYWLQIILASIISTLGFIHNSVAVLIGAMLLAPLIRPINGLGYGIARGGKKIFSSSIKVLIFSVIISIIISYIISILVGFKIENSEILARINPNLIDFFIAIFSAIIAVLSLKFDKLGNNSIIGVALAVSLLQPLSVVGIEIALGDFNNALGAFILFMINLIAIILVVVIFMWLYGFVPHEFKMQEKVFRRVAVVTCFVILFMYPLLFSFGISKENNNIANETIKSMQNILGNDYGDSEITDFQLTSSSRDSIIINATLKIPEDYDLSEITSLLRKSLESEFKKDIKLDLHLVKRLEIKGN